MIIENKVTRFLCKYERINDNIIYLVDLELLIINNKTRKKNIIKLPNELFDINSDKRNRDFQLSQFRYKLKLKEHEKIEITKVTLKEEHGCSVYKR